MSLDVALAERLRDHLDGFGRSLDSLLPGRARVFTIGDRGQNAPTLFPSLGQN